MRRPKILVVKSRGTGEKWCGLLADFNWAGPVGEARYPAMKTILGKIDWANGVAFAAKSET
jgi:hypothetical protein